MRRRSTRPRLDSAAKELVRLLCVCLAALLLLQSLSATFSLVHGAAHWHADDLAAPWGEAHSHWHEQGVAHHHGAEDLALPLGADAHDLHAASLLLALGSALAHGLYWPPRHTADALPAYAGRLLAGHLPLTPRKPPRV